jgi:predicted transcriptional regulator
MYVELELARRLESLASTRRVSKSSILSAALASFLLPDGQDRREVTIMKRLDRLAQQLDRMERDQNVLVETLALFIRYELSVTTSVPEAHQDAVRAQGKARFEKFIAQLARHLQRGGSLVRDLHAEIYPETENSAPTHNGSGNGSGNTQ